MSVIDLEYDPPFDVLFENHEYIGLYGGRGGGKSHAIAEALIVAAMKRKERILCAREIQLSIKESVKFLLEKKIKKFGLEDYFLITREEILCKKTGTLFIFKGLSDHTSESVKSFEGITICWLEESHTVTHYSLNILLPTIRGESEDSKIFFSWNPKLPNEPDGSPGDPVARFLLGKNALPNSAVRKVSWRDNKYFPKRLDVLRRWWKFHDYQKYLHIWEGEPDVRSDALVFTNWKVSNFSPPADTNFLFGADWGFSKDPTVLLRSWVNMDRRRIFVDHEAYKVGVKIHDTPDLFLKIPGAQNWRIVADSGNPQLIAHMKDCHFNIVGAKKGPGSVEVGVKWLQSFDILLHERCKNTIRDFALYSYKVDKETDKPTPILLKANDHSPDALRYATEDIIRKGERRGRGIKVIEM